MPEWRDKWIKIGLCCEPADRERFEKAARECYRFAKLDQPKRVVWVQSPIVGAFAAPIAGHILRGKKTMGFAVGSEVDSAVRSAVDSAVRSAAGSAVRSAVGSEVDSAVHSAVHSAVGSAVHSAVDSAVDSAVGSEVRSAVHSAVDSAVDSAVHSAVHSDWYQYLGGQFWVGGWYGSPSYVSFFQECGLELPNDLGAAARAYQSTSDSACWWWPHRDFVMVCERPLYIKRDQQGRLHCETGKAIEFRDGWGLSVWHGTVVPHEWIADKTALDPLIALKEANIEKRRAAAEIIGWNRVLSALNPVIVDTDPNPQIGQLLRCDLPDSPGEQFLKVRCGTGRDFVLPVPADMRTALEANAWTFPGISIEELRQLEVRT